MALLGRERIEGLLGGTGIALQYRVPVLLQLSRARGRDASSTNGSPPPGARPLVPGHSETPGFNQAVQEGKAREHPARRDGTRTALAVNGSHDRSILATSNIDLL